MFAVNGHNNVSDGTSVGLSGNGKTNFHNSIIFLQTLLYHVLQLTPKRSAGTGVLKRTKWKTNNVEQSKAASAALPEILCPDSLQETVSNLVCSKDSNAISGDFHLTLGNKQLYEGSFLLKSRFMGTPKRRESPWRVSYVAPQSFNDSRWNGTNAPFSMHHSRGFKTHRSIDAEMKRNPTMTTRIRDVLSE